MLAPEDIARIERQIEERGAALTKIITRATAKLDERSTKLDAREREQLSHAQPGEQGSIRSLMGRDRNRQLANLRRELVKETQGNRDAILSKVVEYEAQVTQTRALHSGAVQVLSRHKLGDARRSQLQAQLKDAGPAELRSTADLAKATNDRALAAAVLVTVDRQSRGKRAFDPVEFAESVVGAEVAATQKRLDTLSIKLRAARDLNRSFETGRSDSLGKISRGLAEMQLNGSPDTLGEAVRDAAR